MLTNPKAKAKLLSYLRAKSILHGYFVLSSGVRSTYYVDCNLTNLDPDGAGLVGHQRKAVAQPFDIDCLFVYRNRFAAATTKSTQCQH